MKNISNVISNLDEVKLDHSFQDACSDKEFYDYVYSLGIVEDTLKKYTSSLEDSFEEYKNCKNCPGLEECPNKVHGYKYSPEKDQNLIRFSYIACKKQEKKYHDDAYKENLELFCLPKEIKEASLKNLYKDDKARLPIIKYFKEFIDSYTNKEKAKGLYLTGSFGSGKTSMIAALFNEMAKKGVQSALIYYPEFLRSLKESFYDAEEYKKKFKMIKNAEYLLLDDIGADSVTEWSRDEVLGTILQYRMDNRLATFFTSNLTIEELEEHLAVSNKDVDHVKARRIIERIKQLCENKVMISENKRK